MLSPGTETRLTMGTTPFRGRTGRLIMDQESRRNMREYSRVDAFIPLKTRLTSLEERKDLHSRTSSECFSATFQPWPDLQDSELAEALKILNAKLDAVLQYLTFGNGDPGTLQGSQVTISGGGMSFYSKEAYGVGEFVEMQFMLPTVSNKVFFVYGEVIHVEEVCGERYRTGVQFTVIDEDIREEIVKFVFEKQRETLRKQRRL